MFSCILHPLNISCHLFGAAIKDQRNCKIFDQWKKHVLDGMKLEVKGNPEVMTKLTILRQQPGIVKIKQHKNRVKGLGHSEPKDKTVGRPQWAAAGEPSLPLWLQSSHVQWSSVEPLSSSIFILHQVLSAIWSIFSPIDTWSGHSLINREIKQNPRNKKKEWKCVWTVSSIYLETHWN